MLLTQDNYYAHFIGSFGKSSLLTNNAKQIYGGDRACLEDYLMEPGWHRIWTWSDLVNAAGTSGAGIRISCMTDTMEPSGMHRRNNY
jgi:hypothetical protein